MSSDNVVPIGATAKPDQRVTHAADGERLAVWAGESPRVGVMAHLAAWVGESPRFEVTMDYPGGALPEGELGIFLVVHDDGDPFLLGCDRTSLGIDVRFNGYISCLLERDLRDIAVVDVVETAGEKTRTYQVPLRHC